MTPPPPKPQPVTPAKRRAVSAAGQLLPPALRHAYAKPTQREVHRLLHVLVRERSRIDRGGGQLSLVVFSLPGGVWLKRPRMRKLISVLERRLRITDEVGIINGHRAFALLPDTDALGAEVLARQVQRRVADDGYALSFAVFRYASKKKEPAKLTKVAEHDASDDRHDDPPHTGGNGYGHQSNGSSNGHANGDTGPHTPAAPIRVAAEVFRLNATAATTDTDPVELRQCLVSHFPLRLPWWKRTVDLAVASTALVIASPILVAAAAAIKWESPGPVLFTQLRRGAGRRPFRIYKFRTMHDGAEAQRAELAELSEQDGPAFKMYNDPRVTRVGRFLRGTSVDELPQLLNVLKGDMTLVGPRPLPVHEADECEAWQDARHSVHPGLTCVWQVRGRSRVSFDEWARMDLGYIRKRGLWRDIKILLATVPAVVRRDGAC